ncbi:toll/interleukin-1 receptor domain-containing protein [Streptomyces bacillaris]|uniref:toll/interleukin-1 receptor domain-containing protein n=1 Tax=Streptomyces bacillaris TaxID=68179 RepID=UPI003466A0BC
MSNSSSTSACEGKTGARPPRCEARRGAATPGRSYGPPGARVVGPDLVGEDAPGPPPDGPRSFGTTRLPRHVHDRKHPDIPRPDRLDRGRSQGKVHLEGRGRGRAVVEWSTDGLVDASSRRLTSGSQESARPGLATEGCQVARVFINYRRGEGAYAAALLDELLSAHFGEERVFRAAKSIKAGADFATSILEAVGECHVMLVIVDPGWSSRFTPSDRRPSPSQDWVRREIEEAIRLDRTVVPVLLSGAERLRQDDLPEELTRLACAQYLRFDYRRARQDAMYIAEQLARVSPRIAGRRVPWLRCPEWARLLRVPGADRSGPGTTARPDWPPAADAHEGGR